MRRHQWGLLSGGLLLLVLLALTSLGTGAGTYGLPEVAGYLLGDPQRVADDKLAMIVDTLRLPRTLAALLIGAALAVAASLLQGATRNPLAEPGLLGVNEGAVLALVIGISFFAVESTAGYLVWAGIGAVCGNLVVLALASMMGVASPLRLILAGVALTAVFGGIANYLLLADRVALDQFRFWNLGSLAGVQMGALGTLLPGALAALVLAALLSRRLQLMSMGDQQARALGVSTAWVRAGVLTSASILTACAVAVAGPIGFIGFLAAYCGRVIESVSLPRQLLFSALAGALLLMAADVLARWLIQPYELPVGTLLAAIGAPVLIVVVLRGGFRSLLAER
ncbi:permease [Halopseudomonas pachastrellae]|uniref:Permease n=1 Tax=Halopseudomonas pachastrellae TaxID=254161 RepID=A0A1S8DIN5_9GAMM|nr:iron ABC transporter permease [Halopseudomonas pachastrellae]ONM45243.1 permease [Halopseudomonas pachastrellae]SFM49867.1 iron complex transport system permease protein [Halopseudomonas pachastrellae]